jgi:uncharacterized membrane protein YfcA
MKNQQFIILFVVAFFASLIDSIAGGGGLLTTPSMLLVGIASLNVLATNKFQSCFGTFTSTFNYYKNGLLVEKKMDYILLIIYWLKCWNTTSK